MTAPITGPFNRTISRRLGYTVGGVNPYLLIKTSSWYRQRRPYNLPLSYDMSHEEILSLTGIGAYSPFTRDCQDSRISLKTSSISTGQTYPAAYNKAYEQFRSRVYSDSASLGIALAQRQQAVSMIATRAIQLRKFATHLKRGELKKAKESIGMSKYPRGWRKRGKSFGDLFLEAHFGWSPLIGDIGSAVETLQGGVPSCRVTGSSQITDSAQYNQNMSSNPYQKWKRIDRCVWRISADITVTNPNLHLANSLGFVNPAAVLWDAIPFSFLIGWFVNVESFLNSFTDFWGLSLTNTSYACLWTREAVEDEYQRDYPVRNGNTLFLTCRYRYVRSKRFTGPIPGPTLRTKAPWVLSPTRGLTAVSLLLQRLR